MLLPSSAMVIQLALAVAVAAVPDVLPVTEQSFLQPSTYVVALPVRIVSLFVIQFRSYDSCH